MTQYACLKQESKHASHALHILEVEPLGLNHFSGIYKILTQLP
jgi:hypothetical protein